MRSISSVPSTTFTGLFDKFIRPATVDESLRDCGVRRRCPPGVTAAELIHGLVFHCVAGTGTLAAHVTALTGKTITDGAISQRRALLPVAVFDQIMAAALQPKADLQQHPQAFYQGLRLCGIDGTQFSVTNTPQIKKTMRKAKSRRGRAAFPKIGAAVMVELGLRNPLAAAMGADGESEMVLADRVVPALPEQSLLLIDRYYGTAEFLVDLPANGNRHFLARAKDGLKRHLIEVYPDGSALVEIESGKGRRLVREVLGRVRRGGGGPVTTVTLWTSLLDWKGSPAKELLALYGRRWEQELFYKELKVDLRSTPCLKSHTPLTAMQEVAALILAHAVLVDHRLGAAAAGEVGVLRISFLKTIQVVKGLWQLLEVSEGVLSAAQVTQVVERALSLIAAKAIPRRRHRSCPRKLRQPVSSWPRLRKNTSRAGELDYIVGQIYV